MINIVTFLFRIICRWLEKRHNTCIDCKAEDCNGDYYMVKDCIWNEAVLKVDRSGMLCIECLEKRLGRKLVTSDFFTTDCGFLFTPDNWFEEDE